MYLFGAGVNDDQGQLAVLFGDARVVGRSVGDAFLVVALDGGDGVVTAAVVAVTIIRETHIDCIGHYAYREDNHEDDARCQILGRQHPVGRQVYDGNDDGDSSDDDGHQG